MNRKPLIVLFAIAAFLFTLCGALSAHAATLFEDNAETGVPTDNGWVANGATCSYSTDHANSGTKSLKVSGASGYIGCTKALAAFTPPFVIQGLMWDDGNTVSSGHYEFNMGDLGVCHNHLLVRPTETSGSDPNIGNYCNTKYKWTIPGTTPGGYMPRENCTITGRHTNGWVNFTMVVTNYTHIAYVVDGTVERNNTVGDTINHSINLAKSSYSPDVYFDDIKVYTLEASNSSGGDVCGNTTTTNESEFSASLRTSILTYLDLNESSGQFGDRTGNGRNGSVGAAVTRDASSKIGRGATFAKAGNNHINLSQNAYSFNSPQSVCFWFKTADNTADSTNIMLTSSNAHLRMEISSTTNAACGAGKICFADYDGGGARSWGTTNSSYADNNWHHACYVVESGNVRTLYVDTIMSGTSTYALGTATNLPLWFGHGNGAETFAGSIDEIGVWGRSLNSSDIAELYAAGAGKTYNSTVTVTVANNCTTPVASWVSPTPDSGAVNNTQVTLNAYCGGGGNRTFIWFDATGDPSTLVVNNATSGSYATNVGSSGTYAYKAACWSAVGGFSANTSVRTWVYDVVAPSILLYSSNEFNAQNYSLRNPYDGLVHLNISFSDDHDLYGMLVNITRAGVVYFNATNETLDGTNYNYSRTINASGWPVGRYNVTLQVSDSHTAKEIRPYGVERVQNGLRFVTAEGNDITIESAEKGAAGAEKKKDRYEFEFGYSDATVKPRTFHVKSDKPIVYKPNSGYKAHFVVSNGRGGNWIDFEGIEGTPEVRRINDRHYTVTFQNVPSYVKFKSIGGLNVLEANYTFYVGNYSVQSTSPVYAGELTTLGLNITTESGISNITATLSYNGTSYVPVVESSSGLFSFARVIPAANTTTNASYYWTVNVTQADGNATMFNISGVQVVRDWTITACGTPAFINWTQYDEDTPATKLTGTLAVEITYWVGNRTNAKLYNATFGSANSWAVCFSPADANFSADIYAQNTVPESFTHRFYVQNGTYSNSTTRYSLYNANASNDALYSDMKVTTRYVTSYSYFKNVFAQLQRRYVGEGVWRTVQYDKSGDFGLLFFDVKEQSVDYRLRYYDENNSLLLETDSLKFVCTGAVCELTQLLNPNSATAPSPDVSTVITFNNATSILTVSWDGGTSAESTVSMKVTKQNYNGAVTICSTTQTGAGGSYACNATGYTGELFVTLDVNGEQAVAEYVPIGRASIGRYLSRATQALATFLLMVAIIAFGLFSPIALVIVTIIALVVVFFLGTLTAITATFIIIAAVIGFVLAIKVKK